MTKGEGPKGFCGSRGTRDESHGSMIDLSTCR